MKITRSTLSKNKLDICHSMGYIANGEFSYLPNYTQSNEV